MSKKTKNPNRAGFLAHVDTIRNAENDVDKVLSAARLQRIESGRKPVSPATIAVIIAIALIMCTALVLGYLSGHFIPTLGIVGFITFIGGGISAVAFG